MTKLSTNLLDNMKLCTLCLSNDEWPYLETKAILHDRDGLHSTLGNMWAPLKGHDKYLLHENAKKLGLISKL